MQFFKLSYFQVQYIAAAEYICPIGPLTQGADEIIKSQLSLGLLLQRKHFEGGPYSALAEFGEAIIRTVIPPVAEAATDMLAMVLLKIGNCDYINMMTFPQRGQFEVAFGDKTFVSIPDGSLVYCVGGAIAEGPTFIVVEDKQLGVDDGEYQIPGEMLATAFRNYHNLGMKFAQTIYAMRIIGSRVTFYRADFPQSYLQSVVNGQRPTEHITFFRIGGDRAKVTKRRGLYLGDNGEQRAKAFHLLCSIINTCSTLIRPFWATKQEPPFTHTRIMQMMNTYPH